MLPPPKLLEESPSRPVSETNTTRDSSNGSTTVPLVAVNVADGNDDDPPPYTAIAPPNHVGWLFDFSGIPYSACTATTCRAEATPLAPFQTTLTSGSAFHPEGQDGQHTSISMPLMSHRLFKFGSHRSLFAHSGVPLTDNISECKDSHRRTRRYGAILVAAAVIIFLMVLSLLVRFVMEKSFWRG
ncbi:uncharacterized protein LOC122395094 [Colletes gigas]|uniref:uncharacterized protein LOC122395094 n=1 Tax=Colletes gigas TaxID=935657 RepID=UPI001C9B04D5|nr:uncharacterized protein LOC122395094 [Colletes gigas]XP_043248357.1 uncharacterized protein LOC122395094 [Colletes gigas]XP_043248358.1 uncharacterized protein LOC122395094 [Colletes gigas]